MHSVRHKTDPEGSAPKDYKIEHCQALREFHGLSFGQISSLIIAVAAIINLSCNIYSVLLLSYKKEFTA